MVTQGPSAALQDNCLHLQIKLTGDMAWWVLRNPNAGKQGARLQLRGEHLTERAPALLLLGAQRWKEVPCGILWGSVLGAQGYFSRSDGYDPSLCALMSGAL